MEGWKELKQYVGDFMCKVDARIEQTEKTEKEAYKRGLEIGEKIGMEKAWDAACKIVNMIGLKRKDIFGYMAFSSVMNNFSATEAIKRIKQCGYNAKRMEITDGIIREVIFTADDEIPKCGLCDHFCDDYDCSKYCGAEHGWHGYERVVYLSEEE